MAVSDDEYIQDLSDDDINAHLVRPRGAGSGTRASRSNPRGAAGGWEVTRTWEKVVEGADGTINSTVEDLLETGKRRRLLKDTRPLQRGIFRHIILIIDLSSSMAEKDLRPTRYQLTLRYTQDFVREFFEQNPISQLGVVGMRDGLAVRVSDMSGNPNDHIGNLQKLKGQEPKGTFSLQNALDMARATLYHAPSHETREILLIFGSLLSADPGDIHTTITSLQESQITCIVIGLAAQVAICRTLVSRTNPSVSPDEAYGVALNEQHFRELIMCNTTPPVTAAASEDGRNGTAAADAVREAAKGSLLMMGFPSRMDNTESFCACHSRPTRGGYLCPRCKSKVCAVPSTCYVCQLKLVLSTDLARTYHHLFPLKSWTEVSWERAAAKAADQATCYGCMTPFPAVQADGNNDGRSSSGSNTGRYECGDCGRHYCLNCDIFLHEVVHNCPGCLIRGNEAANVAAADAERPASQGLK